MISFTVLLGSRFLFLFVSNYYFPSLLFLLSSFHGLILCLVSKVLKKRWKKYPRPLLVPRCKYHMIFISGLLMNLLNYDRFDCMSLCLFCKLETLLVIFFVLKFLY